MYIHVYYYIYVIVCDPGAACKVDSPNLFADSPFSDNTAFEEAFMNQNSGSSEQTDKDDTPSVPKSKMPRVLKVSLITEFT